ncbi:Holliday junction branch migration protein RuvA [Peptococcaceae bacterium]|nr:Holliday junction branch migration protein RuvA [Peptococcaceae bacterium]
MIAFLRGKLAAELTGAVVLDVNGVGYRLLVPDSTLVALPETGQTVFLHTHLVLREDNVQLYGFKTEDELTVFIAILNVSGVGPKGALAVLSTYQPDNIRAIIAGEDLISLTKVPGVGKKTAARLILELKDKLGKITDEIKRPLSNTSQPDSILKEAELALQALGYNQSEAKAAVRKAVSAHSLPPDTATLVKNALKYLM